MSVARRSRSTLSVEVDGEVARQYLAGLIGHARVSDVEADHIAEPLQRRSTRGNGTRRSVVAGRLGWRGDTVVAGRRQAGDDKSNA